MSVENAQSAVAELAADTTIDIDDSALARALYSTDASLYRIVPSAVVRPRDSAQVAQIVDVARRTGVPITSRGAGTSIAGNAIGSGLILDFSKYMNRIGAIDPQAATAVVEPGVVHARLQAAAAPHGLRYGPDPSTHTRCTVGGMIGNNACGNRALGYGRSADNIAGLTVVTAAADTLALGPDQPDDDSRLARLKTLVGDHLATIRTEFGRFGRQVSGYSLEHLLPEKGFDVASFMAGTEGTLAVMTEATVKLVTTPSFRHLVVLGYESMDIAADHVPAVLPFGPVACEGLGARIVEVFAQAHGTAMIPDLPRGGGFLYVELAGENPAELAALGATVVADAGALDHRHVTSAPEQAMLWRIREEGAGLASRAWDRPALSGWEDAAVPPAVLGTYLREFDELLAAHGVHGVPFGHFGDGCVHVRIDFDFSDDAGSQRYRDFIVEAAKLAAHHGGSFSGEHGDGRARSELLPLMYSDEAMKLFAGIKDIFDPSNILNPGVMVDPDPLDGQLRGNGRGFEIPAGRKGLRLIHDKGSFAQAVHRCTGVGKCLAHPGAGVMCPSFQATRNEKDSTRGRARVLQELVDGRLLSDGFRDEAVHEALDLCLSCKGCAGDCPTGIDMATYKSEVLHQSYRGRIRPRSHYILGRLPFWARLASISPRLANLGLKIPGMSHLARWVAGVDQRRSLPDFAPKTFGKLMKARGRHTAAGNGKPVLLWSDSFNEYFSTEPAMAAVELLEQAGYEVLTLDKPACCGLTWISTGQLDQAKAKVEQTVAALHPYAEAGIPIVGLEPSCLTVLRADAHELTDDPRAGVVAAHAKTVAELLSQDDQWQAPDLTGTTIVVQPHCHQNSVLGFAADMKLLESTGANVTRLGGCCGLAGNFGVEKGHYEVSVKVAEQQLLPAVEQAPAGAVFLADGFSCRTQLDDLTDVESVHLSELLVRHGQRQ